MGPCFVLQDRQNGTNTKDTASAGWGLTLEEA